MNEANDGTLLRAFRARGDEAAFAELLRRHGGIVLAAARSVVGTTTAAEDVGQAAFLTLARKAAAFEADESVAGWLHHVAICLARDERRKERRRRAREEEAAMLAVEPDRSPGLSEAALAVLHEELASLSAKHRLPLVLHHLEGLSYEAAAARCGCNGKTFSTRLTRAREKLRQRLVARGVTLGAEGVTGVLEESATSVALPAALVAATCQAASLIAAGKTLSGTGLVSAKVAYLTKSALKTLFWAKVKTAAAVVVLTAGVAVAGGVAAHQVRTHRAAPPATPTAVGLRQLSPADAWVRDLLARAEAGPWDTLDFGTGVCARDDWRVDTRGGAADRRVWNTQVVSNEASLLVFDKTPWKRGVIVGRMMILPNGKQPATPPSPAAATDAAWSTCRLPVLPSLADGGYIYIYQGSIHLNPHPEQVGRYYDGLLAERHPRGVWYRFALYFDTQAPGGSHFTCASWPEDRADPPPASAWNVKRGLIPAVDESMRDIRFGIAAKGVLLSVQGLKLVPLGPDMPLPPGWGEVKGKVDSNQ